MGKGMTIEMFTDIVFYNLYKHWLGYFSKKAKPLVSSHINEAYKEFRQSKRAFDRMIKAGTKVPEATFGVKDVRAIKFLTNSDNFYLGKFVTDPDTKKRLIQFIKDNYLEGDLPVGKNQVALQKFKDNFGNFMEGEEWKINRVINTTLNKARNYGAINYMSQAEVAEFEIRGVNDRLQCGYCSWLQGKRFSVETAVNTIETLSSSDPQQVTTVTPFVTAKFKKPADLEGQTAEKLQAMGISSPPFHPDCRDVVVAVL
jgi:hypothetical protein